MARYVIAHYDSLIYVTLQHDYQGTLETIRHLTAGEIKAVKFIVRNLLRDQIPIITRFDEHRYLQNDRYRRVLQRISANNTPDESVKRTILRYNVLIPFIFKYDYIRYLRDESLRRLQIRAHGNRDSLISRAA